MRGRGTIPRTSPDARPLTRAFSSFASTTAQQRTTTSPPARVPERVPRTRPAPPLSEPTRRRRSVPRPRGSSYTSPAPNPRAPARSRAPRGPPPPSPGGAFPAGGRPRRVDVPVADEGLERSAPPVRTPGEAPKAYGAQPTPWGASMPRRAFRRDLETTFEAGPRDVAASNSGAQPAKPSHTCVSSTGWPRGAPRDRRAAARPPRGPNAQISSFPGRRAPRFARSDANEAPRNAHKSAASADTGRASRGGARAEHEANVDLSRRAAERSFLTPRQPAENVVHSIHEGRMMRF